MFHLKTFVRRLVLFGTLLTLLNFLTHAVLAFLNPPLVRILMLPVEFVRRHLWQNTVAFLPFLAGFDELGYVLALISYCCLWGYGVVAAVLWMTRNKTPIEIHDNA